jgi:hypothetical protein
LFRLLAKQLSVEEGLYDKVQMGCPDCNGAPNLSAAYRPGEYR